MLLPHHVYIHSLPQTFRPLRILSDAVNMQTKVQGVGGEGIVASADSSNRILVGVALSCTHAFRGDYRRLRGPVVEAGS